MATGIQGKIAKLGEKKKPDELLVTEDPVAAEVVSQEEEVAPEAGYEIGRGKKKTIKKSYSFPEETVQKLELMVYNLRRRKLAPAKANITRIITLAIDEFYKKDLDEQVRMLRD